MHCAGSAATWARCIAFSQYGYESAWYNFELGKQLPVESSRKLKIEIVIALHFTPHAQVLTLFAVYVTASTKRLYHTRVLVSSFLLLCITFVCITIIVFNFLLRRLKAVMESFVIIELRKVGKLVFYSFIAVLIILFGGNIPHPPPPPPHPTPFHSTRLCLYVRRCCPCNISEQ